MGNHKIQSNLSTMVGATLALSALVCTSVASADQFLKIERSNAVQQQLPVRHLRFEGKTQLLVVDTWKRDRRCGAIGSKAKPEGLAMLLDGYFYPLESVSGIGTKGGVSVVPRSAGMFPKCDSLGAGSAPANSKATGQTELDIEVVVGGQSGRATVPVSGAIEMDFNSASSNADNELLIPMASDVICMQQGSGTGLNFTLTDTNGVANVFSGGLESIEYTPRRLSGPSQVLSVDTNEDELLCVEVPASSSVRGSSASAIPACDFSGDDRIFGSGFDDTDYTTPIVVDIDGVDLQIDMILQQFPTVPAGSDEAVVYDLIVQNCGDTTASNVHIRDLFPNGLAPSPRFVANGSNSQWSCEMGWSCAPQNGSGYVDTVLGNIGSGENVTITVTRRLEDTGDLNVGQITSVVGAVVSSVADGEMLDSNNAKMWNIPLQLINNEVPVLTINGQDNPVSAVSASPINEGDGSIALSGLTISAADVDGSVTSVTGSVNGSTPGLLSGVIVNDSNMNNITITAQLLDDDVNGTALIDLVATDNEGAQTTAQIELDVQPVNDPPTFTVLDGFVPPGTFTGSCDVPFGVDCADQVWPTGTTANFVNIENFVSNLQGGAPDETGDVVTIQQIVIAPGSDDIWHPDFGAAAEPSISASGTLTYIIDGTSGEATLQLWVTDDGGANNQSEVLEFTVKVENSAPVVCGVGSVDINNCNAVNSPAAMNEDLANSCDASDGWFLKTDSNLTVGGCEADDIEMGSNAVWWGVHIFDAEGDSVSNITATAVDAGGNPDNSILTGDLLLVEDTGFYQVIVEPSDIVSDANGTAYIAFTVEDSAGSETVTAPIAIEVRAVNDKPVFAIDTSIPEWDAVEEYLVVDTGTRSLFPPIEGVVDTKAIVFGPADEQASQDVSSFSLNIPNPGCDTNSGENGVLNGGFMTSGGALILDICDGQSGTVDVEIQLEDDGGTDHGGEDTSDVVMLTIALDPPPSP